MMDVIPTLTFMSLALQKEYVEHASVQANNYHSNNSY